MKILHVYKDYHPILGGIENHMKTLAEAQAAAGHDVTVLVTNPGQEMTREIINGVRVIRAWRVATIASTPLSPVFPLWLTRLKPDMTHLHFPYPVGEFSQLMMGNGRSTVITYHSDVVKQQRILRWYRPLLLKTLQKADRIIATSDRYIESSVYLKPIANKCVVVPLAVALQDFNDVTPYLPPATMPTLLFVGQHRYYKGLDDLIRAMPQIEARLLVGGDGPMRPIWEQMVQELGVSSKVQFLGRVSDDDLPRLYASADLFVLPANARSEAFGKVLLEAMAAGLPCVTTEVGTGTSYVVQDGVTGFVVPPKSPDGLATAVNTLLTNENLRRQMGAAGRARVEQEFTPEKMIARVDAVYNDVLAN
ncbi:MAG: glycosyltransferase [Chloroflexi bacterium]|nr:glycosyltransferase [Chloroflexota bacterium]